MARDADAIVMMRTGLRYAALSLLCAAALSAACARGGNDARPTTTAGPADTSPAATGAAATPSAGAGPQQTRAAGNENGRVRTPLVNDPTTVAELGGDIAGGDPDAPRRPVGDLPTPRPGVTPAIDPPGAAPAAADTREMKFLVDMDAATYGAQPVRTVKAGDVFRVAIVLANIPDGTSLSAFNFYLDYDRTKVVAPSYTGGPSTDRNPDLDENSLGSGWLCIPAPEGDVDDPGGIEGDGDPATGRALLSCFNAGGGPSGTVIMAVVEFHAVASGEVTLSLSNVSASDYSGVAIAQCPGDEGAGPVAPCDPGTVTVE